MGCVFGMVPETCDVVLRATTAAVRAEESLYLGITHHQGYGESYAGRFM